MPKNKPACPNCRSAYVHTSRTRTPGELLATLAGARLRRCHNCDFRYLTRGNWILAVSALRTAEITVTAALTLAAVIIPVFLLRSA